MLAHVTKIEVIFVKQKRYALMPLYNIFPDEEINWQ